MLYVHILRIFTRTFITLQYVYRISVYAKLTLVLLFQEYSALFEGAGNNPGDKTLEDKFFEHEVNLNVTAEN